MVSNNHYILLLHYYFIIALHCYFIVPYRLVILRNMLHYIFWLSEAFTLRSNIKEMFSDRDCSSVCKKSPTFLALFKVGVQTVAWSTLLQMYIICLTEKGSSSLVWLGGKALGW